jgi:transposase
METNPTKQRQHFYRDYASGQWSMSELCDRYQISRPTGYKWVDRIEALGLEAVEDRSRAPNRHTNRTPEHVKREILVLREKYGWGATKLRQIVGRNLRTGSRTGSVAAWRKRTIKSVRGTFVHEVTTAATMTKQ